MNKKIGVLCRGKSLQYIDILPDCDEYIIVNRFGEELQNKNVAEKVGNKPITHILSPAMQVADDMLKYDFFKKFNIKKIILPYAKECAPSNYPRFEGRNGMIPVETLSDKVKNYMWTPTNDPRSWVVGSGQKPFNLPTSGIAAVCHAAITLDYDEIYVIGMDFYDGVGYAYSTQFGPDTVKLGTHKGSGETDAMKQFLTKNLAEKLPNKEFYIHTLSNFQSNLKNIHIIKISEDKRKIAVVAGGWHFPVHFYKEMIKQEIPYSWEVDYFCISHRDPDLNIVYDEKEKILNEYCMDNNNILNRLDNLLYEKPISKYEIENLGWKYIDKPNVMGDFNFVNQWTEEVNYEDYDAILFTHDDNFILSYDIFTKGITQFKWEDWLTIANGGDIVPEHADYGLRGSFAIFKTEIIKLMGGKFRVDNVVLTRENEIETPFKTWGHDSSISDWNKVAGNFGNFIKDNNLTDKLKRFSNKYRISKFCIEGERGFLSKGGDVPQLIKYLEDNFDINSEENS